MTGFTRAEAVALDRDDPLSFARDRFSLPDGVIYLDGNSLGAPPRAAAAAIADLVQRQWGRDLISGWNRHDWIGLPRRLGARIAPLLGAAPGEVIVCDTTSVNLFKLAAAALRLRPDRRTILCEAGNFPTDRYVAEGVAELCGGGVSVRTVPTDAIERSIDHDTALLLLCHVHYRTGQVLDMPRLTGIAHRRGALTLWDLSHSAGAVPVALGACEADLAVGCGYKFLNGGPGAPAFLFAAGRLQEALRSPLSGWFGHADPFAFEPGYRPAAGLDRFLCGTPPVLGMAALEAGLATFDGIDPHALFAKGRALRTLLARLLSERCGDHGMRPAPAADPRTLGSQLGVRHPDAWPICQALIARGVIGDFRAPDLLRFGIAPLYTRFVDIHDAVERLRTILAERSWDAPEHHRRARVT